MSWPESLSRDLFTVLIDSYLHNDLSRVMIRILKSLLSILSTGFSVHQRTRHVEESMWITSDAEFTNGKEVLKRLEYSLFLVEDSLGAGKGS